MIEHLTDLLKDALNNISFDKPLDDLDYSKIKIDKTKNTQYGDYSSNLALVLSKRFKQKPQEFAQVLVENIPKSEQVSKIEIAGVGFINFFVNQESQANIITKILQEKSNFGLSEPNSKKSICLEFVSVNPTGPLHVGHGRGAAFGASLTNLLKTSGYKVCSEYYMNDDGRQMDILAVSVWLRYLDLIDETSFKFPTNGYQGEYIIDIAKNLYQNYKDKFYLSKDSIYQNICKDESDNGDKEKHIDDLIIQAKNHLQNDYKVIFNLAKNTIIDEIKQDLINFRVNFDIWFSEKTLSQDVGELVNILQNNNEIYEKDDAKWFCSTKYGDEKDRVVIRKNGQGTYFSSDLVYHKNKIERGFDKLINVWGADHHGYIARVKAGIKAMGFNPDILKISVVQLANLFRGSKAVIMSTRSGSFVTLKDLYQEVGVDATRFFYIERKIDQHLDFDLELAKAKKNENPVYYIQYAHARVFQVLEKLKQLNLNFDEKLGLKNLHLLTAQNEIDLISKLNQYQRLLEKSAKTYAPHKIATYLKESANDFHSFYNNQKIIVDDDKIRNARVCLSLATAQVIKNGLTILGVSAPKKM